jgi:two-component system LytT family sensor kinase
MTTDPSPWRKAVVGAAAATGIAGLVTAQNYVALAARGREAGWGALFLGELPVWFTYLALTPLIVRLARQYPFTGRRAPAHLLLHTAVAVAVVAVVVLVTTAVRSAIPGLLPAELGFWEVARLAFTGSLIAFLFVYAAVAGIASAWRLQRDAQRREVRESQLEAQLANARLDLLRMQMQPHFLFNTLHGISALMGRDVVGARRMMTRLSELLRASLEETPGHEVALDDELGFLDRYLEIQELRFGDRLRVERDIDDDARGLAVPRLLLQPLVENAVKHGIAHRPAGGRVRISARREGDRLRVAVCDDGPGFDGVGGHPAGEGDGGMGLANTAARIAELYGPDAVLETGDAPGGGAQVSIEIPARAAPARRGP